MLYYCNCFSKKKKIKHLVNSIFNDKNEVDIQINPMHSTEVIVDSQL